MARKSGGTILQDELYPADVERSPARSDHVQSRHARSEHVQSERGESAREELDDARLVDLDVAEESPFLRGQKRVSARRGSLPKKTASRLLWATLAMAILCVAAIVFASLYQYGEHSWRFRVESSDNLEITGTQNVTKAQIMEVLGADIGRNIFFVPLAQQKAQIEQIPWVESASVMRFVPNRLKVEIHERTPVAFARVGPHISLIDAGGTLMELPQKHKYSFPVILGMNPGEPLSTRAPRMKAYNELVRNLDAAGARYSQDLSEVDLSDLENLKVRVNDPAGDVLVELGSSDYLKRYKTYVSHVREWRQQFQKLESVNLRYDNQVIVNPDTVKPDTVKSERVKSDMAGKSKQAALAPAAAKAAAAVGVKPAALITNVGPHEKPLPKPAFELTEKKLDPNTTKKPAARARVKKSKVAKSVAGKNGAGKASSSAAASRGKPGTAKTAAPRQRAAQSAPPAATIPKPSPGIAKQQTSASQNPSPNH
jgi:cell division protein FtsQ